jgi:DnaJ-class molecular chaperone
MLCENCGGTGLIPDDDRDDDYDMECDECDGSGEIEEVLL